MFKRDNRPDAPIDNLISAGTRIDGDVQFSGGMHLDGTVSGSVKPTDGAANRLVIGPTGLVQGSVEARIVELSGTVLGDITAATRVVLGSTARIEGNLHYGTIEMAAGAQIKGKLVKLEAESKTP
ncbi:MAG: polymer-forming cytoskeletal protein [Pseudomonadota bacterium]